MSICISLLSPLDGFTFSFHDQIQERSTKTFEHRSKKNKITGFTIITYETEEETDSVIELSKNLDHDRSVFSEKRLWFHGTMGELQQYQENDFRTGIKTLNTYEDDRIQTEIWENEEKTEISLTIRPDLVPFEVLPHFLQANLEKIKHVQSLTFTLYLPVIAYELVKKGLPSSLGQPEMKAFIVKQKTRDTVFGERETITIRVEPTSFFVKALLPGDKSKFDFTYLSQPPFTLVLFEEGEARSVLSKVD